MLAFIRYQFTGLDAQKFLQGQVTVHVERVTTSQYTAICDLKGRIEFGLWLTRHSAEHFEIVVTQDQSENFEKHVKKYGAFSKISLTEATQVYPTLQDATTVFDTQPTDIQTWEEQAILHGQAWITANTAHVFQPQELRLHQRHGVHYDKGCYLGQEIVARLWFKAKPKSWLHLVKTPVPENVAIVNAVKDYALVVAKPDALQNIIELPTPLNEEVGRPK